MVVIGLVVIVMKISEVINHLNHLKDRYGDLPCVSEYCENLWLLSPGTIFFMERREVNLDQIMDVIVIG